MVKWKTVLQKNYHQLIFVFIAFLLMILVSFIFVSSITRKQLLSASNEALHTVEANIKTNLREPEATLVGSTFTVRNMLANQNASQDEVLQYLTGLTDWLQENEERVSGFNGIYGFIRGNYLDGMRWQPPADYVPQERPWYIAAKKKAGEIAMTTPYIDAQTQVGVISLSQEFYGLNGEPLGVISLDVLLARLTEYVCSLQQGYGGYGMLLDNNFHIVAHPVKNFAGMSLQELSGDYTDIAAALKTGDDVSGKTIRDTDGKQMIIFFRQIYNGWYVGMLTPVDSYYSDMYQMAAILISLGTILMLALSFILMRLSAAKMRSDEENQSKSSFLARMSHEIRTPMNAILGMVELMLRKDLPRDAREEAAAIKQAGGNLLAIINDILDLSKIESDRMEIISIKYQLVSLINDVINLIHMRIGEKPVLFVVNIDSKLPGILIGDEVRLRQVLLNLLSNAAKYTMEGHISLNVSGELKENNMIMLAFTVADTGIGIKEDDLPKLFGDFTRFDARNNNGIEGTGLGLAIARSLCRFMGGDITVSSRYGEGSVFTAMLPQKIADDIPLAVVDEPDAHNILVYETRMLCADSIVFSVQNLGVRCRLATDHGSFVESLACGKFSFIFTTPFLFDTVRETVDALSPDTKPVLLTEFSETPAFLDAHAISMPIYCVHIANILNGTADAVAYGEAENIGVRFSAPSARILIVDDIEINLKVAAGLISPYKTQIDCCASGQEAIGLVRKNHYDIVFMDHMMPQMDGIETTQAIRALKDARFQRLPVIALTANAISGMREMFLKNGFDDYLAKPIEIVKLNEIMDKWIPEEKRVKEDVPEKCASDSQAPALDIEGLDTKRGLFMTGGSEGRYREVLALYCRDVAERLDILKEPPDETNLALFITQVHALKSASASIGAATLSEQAAFLEDAGHQGNMDAIRERLNDFRTELVLLIERINNTLPLYRTEAPAGESAVIDRAALVLLKEALEAEDIRTIDAMLDELARQTHDTDSKSSLDSISECVLLSEFEEAVSLINDLLHSVDDE